MKGRSATKVQKAFWDRLASEVGCIACRIDGRQNTHVSIHHIDGRTKPTAHDTVLALCGPHHQDDGSGTVAIHPWKARFEEKYGNQYDLLARCKQMLEMDK